MDNEVLNNIFNLVQQQNFHFHTENDVLIKENLQLASQG